MSIWQLHNNYTDADWKSDICHRPLKCRCQVTKPNPFNVIKLQVNSSEAEIQIHCEHLCKGSRSYSNWSRNWICHADHLNQGPLTRRNHCPRSHFASIIPRMSPNLVQNPSPKDKIHDDVIQWKRFPRNWSFVRGIHRSRWIPHTKASYAELWCFFFICVWKSDWVNSREADDLRRYRCRYDVLVMYGLDTIWALVEWWKEGAWIWH